MGDASRYWKLVRIDGGGNRKILEIPAARSFFTQLFGELANDDVPDGDIQRQLMDLYRDSSGESSLLAERCLLCFLSRILEQGCLKLTRRFGEKYNFHCSELLVFVLEDDGRLSPYGNYQCFSRQILQSFDATQGSLTAWTNFFWNVVFI
jgi:hypothetical protein